jgi:hypothetical protein
MSLSTIFKLDRKDEYERLVLLAVYIELMEVNGQSIGLSPIKIASMWPSLSNEKKEGILKSFEKLEEEPYSFSSIEYLNSTKKELIENQINFIKEIANYIVNADSLISDEELKYFENINKIITNSYSDVSKITKEKISQLITTNNITLFNDKLLIELPEELKKIISNNQDIFNSFGDTTILNSIQSVQFLDLHFKEIFIIWDKFSNSPNPVLAEAWFDILFTQISSYNKIYILVNNQINSVQQNDRVSYFEYYQTLDMMGIYTTGDNKKIQELLENISLNQQNISGQLKLITYQLHNIENGINKINDGLVQLTRSVKSLENTVSEGFYKNSIAINNLSNNISEGFNIVSDHLKSINSGINYNNLVTTINAYQTYKINSKMNKILINS